MSQHLCVWNESLSGRVHKEAKRTDGQYCLMTQLVRLFKRENNDTGRGIDRGKQRCRKKKKEREKELE